MVVPIDTDPFAVNANDEILLAPTREIMFGLMDDRKATMLTPREIVEQARNLKSIAGEIEIIVGLWDRKSPYDRVLRKIEAAIADNNIETRRIRRRAGRAAKDAKLAAVPKWGVERKAG